MSDVKLAVSGLDYYPEISTTQFVIPAGAGATFSGSATTNIATITFNAAHGLTSNPAAGVAINGWIGFGGSTSAPTGTGILVGNYFRILNISSTTAIQIYVTLSALTVTSLTGIPVFVPPFFAQQSSTYGAYLATAGTNYPAPQIQAAQVNMVLGANCVVLYSPLNVGGVATTPNVFLDQTTTPAAGTPSTAPTTRSLVVASSSAQAFIDPPQSFVAASGTTATSYFSVVI